MKRISRAWLSSAQDDLDTIALLLSQPHLTNVVSFHAQQAVEKTLKAVIEELEIGLVKTHSLSRLYELVKSHYDIISDLDILEQLEAVYTESRYPDELGLLPHGKPTPQEAEKFYIFAKEIHEVTEARLTSAAT